MKFNQATQNGVQPVSEEKSLSSVLGVFASSTSSVYGRSVSIKCILDAAMYKTEPVVIYDIQGGNHIEIGQAEWVNYNSAVLVLNNLSTGTHQIYGTWPGELKYNAQTTKNSPVTITVAAGAQLGGNMVLQSSPSSGSLVVGEGTATFQCILTTSTYMTGNIQFFDNGVLLASVPLFENAASVSAPSLTAGTHVISANWPGGDQFGTVYAGRTTSTNYTVLRGTTVGGTLSMEITPDHGVYNEGTVTFKGTLNTSTVYPGKINFYRGDTLLGYGTLSNNTATFSTTNNFDIGTSTYTAVWDGNQESHPRYIEKTTSTVWETLAREVIPAFNLTISPNPTAYRINTTFRATISTSTTMTNTVNGYASFVVDGTVLGTSTFVNNVATFQTAALNPKDGAVAYAYYGGSPSIPKYFPATTPDVVFDINEGIDLPVPLDLTITSDGYLRSAYNSQLVKDYPIKLTSTATTSTQLTGIVTIVERIGLMPTALTTSSWVNNRTTATLTYNNTSSHSLYSLWDGGEIGGQFYRAQRSAISTVTMAEKYTLVDAIDRIRSQEEYRNGIAVTGRPFKVIASIQEDGAFNGTARLYVNGSIDSTSTFVNTNTITFSGTYPTHGTTTYRVDWLGGTGPDGRPFNGKNSTTGSFTVYEKYTLDTPITLAVKSTVDPLADETYGGDSHRIVAIVNTSSQLSGPVDFYVDGNFVSTGTLSAATTTSVLYNLSTGSHTLTATWKNGSADYNWSMEWPGYHYFFNKDAETTTATVRSPYVLYPTMASIAQPVITDEPFSIVMNANTSTAAGLTVTAKAGVLTLGTSTIAGTGTTFTNLTIANSGTYTFQVLTTKGFSSNHKLWAATATNTQTFFVDIARQFPGTFTLTSLTATNVITSSTRISGITSSMPNVTGYDVQAQLYNVGTGLVIANATFANNVVNFDLPPNFFASTGTYQLQARWPGHWSAPKYYGTQTGVITQTILPQGRTTQVATPLVTWYKHNIDGTTNTVATFTATITSVYPTHPALGSINLTDGTQQLASAQILYALGSANTGTATITWNPANFNQIDQGTRTLQGTYPGDYWNLDSSTTTSFVALTRRSMNLTLTSSKGNNGNFTRPETVQLIATSDAGSSNFNGRTVTFYSGSTLLGSTSSVNATATLNVAGNQFPVGTNSVTAVFPQDHAYTTATSNAIQVNMSKASITNFRVSIDKSVYTRPTNIVYRVSSTNAFNATKSVELYDNATLLTTLSYTGTNTTYTINANTVSTGSHSVYATFAGDADYNSTTTNTATYTNNKHVSVFTLTMAGNVNKTRPNAIQFTLANNTTFNTAQTITLEDAVGTVLTSTNYTGPSQYIYLNTSLVPLGSYTVKAKFAGSVDYLNTESGGVSFNLAKGIAPAIVLSNTTTVYRPDAVLITATYATSFYAGKTISLYDTNGLVTTFIATSTTNTVSIDSTVRPNGINEFYATWAGDNDYLPYESNHPLIGVYDGIAALTLTASTSSIRKGQTFVVTATSTSSHYEGEYITLVGVSTLFTGGKATRTVNGLEFANTGTNTIVASHAGDNFAPVTSNSISIDVQKGIPSLTFAMSPNTTISSDGVTNVSGSLDLYGTTDLRVGGIMPTVSLRIQSFSPDPSQDPRYPGKPKYHQATQPLTTIKGSPTSGNFSFTDTWVDPVYNGVVLQNWTGGSENKHALPIYLPLGTWTFAVSVPETDIYLSTSTTFTITKTSI